MTPYLFRIQFIDFLLLPLLPLFDHLPLLPLSLQLLLNDQILLFLLFKLLCKPAQLFFICCLLVFLLL